MPGNIMYINDIIMYMEVAMSTVLLKHKHLRLDQKKIDRARKVSGLKTETEVIEKALDILLERHDDMARRGKMVESVLKRRENMKPVTHDVSDWIREAREERNSRYGI